MVKVFIDPGHDLNTLGKGVPTMKEFEFNKETAIRLANHLKKHQNVEVVFSHNLDDGIDQSLQSRTDYANKWGADVYVSIHANAGAVNARGIETFIYLTTPQSTVDVATLVHNNVINVTGMKNRGVKRENFHVLRESHMNAFLIEAGFMTNPEDLALLKSADYREKVALGIARGLVDYYDLVLKPQPAPAPTPQPAAPAGRTDGIVHRVIVNGTQIGAYDNVDSIGVVVAEHAAKGAAKIELVRV